MINLSRISTLSIILLLIFVVSNNVFAYSFNPPDEKTGAPNQSDCTDCHLGNVLNSAGGSFVLTVPTVYVPGEEYSIVVDLMRTGQSRWGFQMTALNGNNARAGTFTTVDANTQLSVANSKQYIEQTTAGTAQGTRNRNQWSFKWTAPSTDVGPITFYSTGNAANNNSASSGDYIYTTSATANAAAYGVAITGVGEITKSISDASSGVNYTLRVTNNGNITDTFNLETSGDVTGTLSQTSVQLNAGASANITLSLPGSALATADNYGVKVKATSRGDNSKTSEITTTTTILPVYDVALTGVGSLQKTTNAETGASYTLRITNNGNTEDTIRLTTSGDVNATISSSSVTLKQNTSSNVTLRVSGDALAKAGDYKVKVTATSQGDDTITDEITTTTTISKVYGFTFEGVGELTTETSDASEGVSFTLKITNTGNTDDVITLAKTGTKATLSQNEVSIAYGESTQVTLTISADDLAKAGDYEVKLTATSKGDNTITHEVTTSTNILPVYSVKLDSKGPSANSTQDSVAGVTYNLTVTNTGNTEDTIILGSSAEISIGGAVLGAFKRTEEQAIPTTQLEITLAAGTSTDVLFIASGDLLTRTGEYPITVTATSKGDNTKSAEVTTTTTILPVYSVTLISKSPNTGSTQDSVAGVTYNLTVTNTGNTEDTIILGSSAEIGIGGAVLGVFKRTEEQAIPTTQLEITLAAGTSTDVLFIASGDLLTRTGEYPITVTATSKGDNTKSAEVTTTTTILPVYSVTLISKSPNTGSTQDSVAGVTYNLTVTNTGNTEDTIILGSSAEIGIGGAVLGAFKRTEEQEIPTAQLEITLAAGTSTDVLFIASGDLLTRSGEYPITVTATSKGDNTKSAEVTTTTTILPVYNVTLKTNGPNIGSTQDSVSGVTYNLTVTNTGNTEDTIILGSSAEIGIGGAVLGAFKRTEEQEIPTAQLEITLAAGASVDVLFIATGDLLTRSGEYPITVTASSKGDNTKSTEVTTTTTILPVYSVTLISKSPTTGSTQDSVTGVTYNLTVTNTGNTEDTIILGSSAEIGIGGAVLGAFKRTEEQEIPTAQLEITLAAGASTDVLFIASGDLLTRSGKYPITVTATSKGDNTKSAEVTTTTTILPVYSVTLISKSPTTGSTKDSVTGVTYNLTVTNTGNTEDTIILGSSAEIGIGGAVLGAFKRTEEQEIPTAQLEITLAAGASTDVLFIASGDLLTRSGEYPITVTATSKGDTTKSDEVTTTTIILPVYGFTLEGVGELSTETADATEDVSYTFKITNNGNTEDVFTLATSGTKAILSQNEISIAYGESAEVTLTISADDLARAGNFEVKITATSKSDNTITHEVTTTTTVLPVYGVTLKSETTTTASTQDSVAGVTYNLTVTNTGNTEDTIILGSSAEVGIGGAVLGAFKRTEEQEIPTAQLEITLAAGASTDVLFIASGDLLTRIGEYPITVTATSKGDNTKSNEVTTTTTILPVYSVTLISKSPTTGSTQDSVTGVTYNLTVTNTGNTEDTIILGSSAEVGIGGAVLGAFKRTEEQEIPTAQLEITLAAGASTDVLFIASGDLLTSLGEYPITVTATSKGDSTKTAEVQTTTIIVAVPPVYGVELTGKGKLTSSTEDAVEGISYTLTVTNTGNTHDTIVLGSSAETGSKGSILGTFKQTDDQDTTSSQLEIELAEDESKDVLFTIAGDSYTESGEYEVNVSAISKTDSTKTAEVSTTTTILPVFNVTLVGKGDITTETTEVSNWIRYVFTVKNTGNTSGTVDLVAQAEIPVEIRVHTVTNLEDGKELILVIDYIAPSVDTASNQTTTFLRPGGTAEISIYVFAESLQKAGEYDVKVIATHQGDKTKSAEVTTKTTITPTYGVKLQGKDELIGETMDPLKGVSYVLTVTNEGNAEDTFLLGSSAEVGIEGTVIGLFTASDDQEIPTSQIEVMLAPGASKEVTFTAKGDFFTKPGENEIVVTGTSKSDDTKTAEITTTTTITPVPWDLNADGTVNILDLVLVSNQFGESGDGLSGDVNMDGTVNILDLVQVASYFGKSHVEIVQENQ